VTRLSLPRCTIQDFVYDNKVIPKGTVIFLNVWACNMGKSSTLSTRPCHPADFSCAP
jgi:hypothetical protein